MCSLGIDLVTPKIGLCHQPAREERAVHLESRIPFNGGAGGMEWAKEFQPPTQTIIEVALEDYFSGNSPRFYTADYKLKIMSPTITPNIANLVLIGHIMVDCMNF